MMNNDQYFHAHPWRHLAGPSDRQIGDLSNWDNSRFITYTGQSGNPVSPHDRDMAEPWLRGEYVPMRFFPELCMRGEERVLRRARGPRQFRRMNS